MRIKSHPIVQIRISRDVSFSFNCQEIVGKNGDTIASALWANNIKTFRHSEKLGEGRSMYCGIGNCYECRVHVKDRGMVKACITPISEGMLVFSDEREDVSS